jgi:PST family polysaccharide transporter
MPILSFKLLPNFLKVRLEASETLRRILANSGWLFADKILRLGVGLFVGVWVARYLGPQQFGLLNYAMAFVGLFGSVATLGLDGIVVRDIVRYPHAKDEILGTAFGLKLAGGTAALAVALAVISSLRPGDALSRWMVVIIAAGLVFQAFDTIDFWFQSQVKSKYTVYAKNTAFVLVTFLKIVLILLQAPLIAFAWALLGDIALGALGLTIAYRRNGYFLRAWRGSLTWAKRLLRDSWPLIFAGAAVAIYMRIDQIMLGQMIGNESVGIYSAAVRVSEIWYFIPGIVVSSLYPSIVKARQHDREIYYKKIQQLYTILIWTAIICAFLIAAFSTRVIVLLYGARFADAGPILSIHIWTAIFVFYGVAKAIFIQCENMQLFFFICTFSGALANVLLNLVLIKWWGGVGAAWATLIAQIISALVVPSLYYKDRISVRLFFRAIKSITNPRSGLFGLER